MCLHPTSLLYGLEMPSKYVENNEHIVRNVSWSKLRKNADETEVYGPAVGAFELRIDKGEEYLSASWLEYFEGVREVQIKCIVEEVKGSNFVVGKKCRFAIGNVGEIKNAFKEAGKRNIRVINEPKPNNRAYVAVRGWVDDDQELLDLIAWDAWAEVWSLTDVEKIEQDGCQVSARGLE